MRQGERLKMEGHHLIEQLIVLGEERDDIYRQMAKRLEIPSGHFSHVDDLPTLIAMNMFLTNFRDRRVGHHLKAAKQLEAWKKEFTV